MATKYTLHFADTTKTPFDIQAYIETHEDITKEMWRKGQGLSDRSSQPPLPVK